MEKVFTSVYEECVWGNNKQTDYKGSSGGGSDVEYNKDTYVPFLKKFIKNNNIQSVVDLGCGDFRCGKLIYDDLNVKYTGYDAYNKVVEANKKQNAKYTFIHLDFSKHVESIVEADLCILKDVIQHWCLEDINAFLDYLTTCGKYKYILICNCCDQRQDNTNIVNGGWRPLSSSYLPLKKYKPVRIFKYNTKEVCLIKL